MTSEEAGLLDSIVADPDDVGLRLIYADWLEDHGRGEQAEFTRAQVANGFERAKYGHGDPDPNPELKILFGLPEFLGLPDDWACNYGWNGTGATDVELNSGTVLVYSGGLVESVRCEPAWWVRMGKLLRRHPLRNVTLAGLQPMHVAHVAYPRGSGHYWTWEQPDRAGGSPDSCRPPMEIFRLLDGNASVHLAEFGAGSRMYRSNLLAMEALSDACVAWARSGEFKEE